MSVKISKVGGDIVQDHKDKGANYVVIALSHYTDEYNSLLLSMPQLLKCIKSRDDERAADAIP
jgi:pectate lyase